jgi:hypothetical protein
MMQDYDSKPADLSMLSIEELEVLEKVLDYTHAREVAAPPGKRPLVADTSGAFRRRYRDLPKDGRGAECR